jgi:hypothetical protein
VGLYTPGHPVVEARPKDVIEAWLVTNHGNGNEAADPDAEGGSEGAQGGPCGPIGRVIQSVVGDDKGTWLATTDGLYLSPRKEPRRYPQVTGQLGGGCA